jgi:hypothetical protein
MREDDQKDDAKSRNLLIRRVTELSGDPVIPP